MLHLMLATLSSSDWPTAWQNWSASSRGLDPGGWTAPSGLTPDPGLIAGIAAYRRHPWQRILEDPPAIWEEGSSRLLDYGRAGDPVILFVPSLVNRAYILDLMPEHSMLRFLAQAGVRPLLLDWGYPGAVERSFTLTDYVAGRLERALQSIGSPVTLAGYCMGGLMAVAAAQRRPDLVSRLVLLATPWDFQAEDPAAAVRLAALLPGFEPMLALGGTLPIDALQMLFALLDPGSVGAKYRNFGTQDQASARARMFVAVEDWLNDGVPLPAAVARETIGGWYGANSAADGQWRIAGLPILPEELQLPCWVAMPSRDRLVPRKSAEALAERIAGAETAAPKAGHVGMVAGSGAQASLWQPLIEWLARTG